jgi:hypothetical protein
MGYCMDQRDAEFKIKPENMAGAIAAVKALDGKEAEHGAGGFSSCGGKTTLHYSWVDVGFSRGKTTLEALMGAWRWSLEVERDDDGKEISAVGINFEGEKSGDDMVLFRAIAPFVEPGSYIEMHGEDGYLWRFYFDGQTCVEQEGKVTFE